MSRDSIFKCLIAFLFGFIVFCMTRGDGLSVGGDVNDVIDKDVIDKAVIDKCSENRNKATLKQKNELKKQCVDLLSNYQCKKIMFDEPAKEMDSKKIKRNFDLLNDIWNEYENYTHNTVKDNFYIGITFSKNVHPGQSNPNDGVGVRKMIWSRGSNVNKIINFIGNLYSIKFTYLHSNKKYTNNDSPYIEITKDRDKNNHVFFNVTVKVTDTEIITATGIRESQIDNITPPYPYSFIMWIGHNCNNIDEYKDYPRLSPPPPLYCPHAFKQPPDLARDGCGSLHDRHTCHHYYENHPAGMFTCVRKGGSSPFDHCVQGDSSRKCYYKYDI